MTTHDNAEYVKLEDGCILWDGPVNSAYGPHRTAWQAEQRSELVGQLTEWREQQ